MKDPDYKCPVISDLLDHHHHLLPLPFPPCLPASLPPSLLLILFRSSMTISFLPLDLIFIEDRNYRAIWKRAREWTATLLLL